MGAPTRRLTTAQAVVMFLKNQYVERDGVENSFFAGCFGIFARHNVAPFLRQLASESSQDPSVNDSFKPLSRYWDRVNRPEQLVTALPEATRVLASPAQTGGVTVCLPQDVQTEVYDYPVGLFDKRVWRVPRNRPD